MTAERHDARDERVALALWWPTSHDTAAPVRGPNCHGGKSQRSERDFMMNHDGWMGGGMGGGM